MTGDRELLQTILDAAPVMIVCFGADGEILWANRCYAETIGWDPGMSAEEVLAACLPDPELRREAKAFIARADGTWREFPTRTTRGEVLDVTWMDLRLEDGRVIGVGRDVTDIKRAQEAHRQERELLASLTEASPMAVVRVDRDGRIAYANPRAFELFGVAAGESGSPPDHELHWTAYELDGTPLPDSRLPFARVFATGRPVKDVRLRIEGADGERRAVAVSAAPIHGRRGETEAVACVLDDISDRLAIENELIASERRYRAFFEHDVTADFASTAEGWLIECNPAFVEMFGFESMEEALATPVTGLYPDPEERDALLEALRCRRSLRNHELELCRRDGRLLNVVGNIYGLVDEDGELASLRGYLFDVTQHRATEAQLREAQKMDALGRMAGGVAHDFNNILQAIVGLTRSAVPGDTAEARVARTEIEALVERGGALTRQLLLFSRKGRGRREVLDLCEAVEEAANLLRRLLPERVQVKVEVEKDGDMRVAADPSQLQQVLMNLGVNARDAMPEGGTLSLRCRRDETGALVEVADNGTGMEPEVAELVFEPFFTTRAEGGGTGLGLSVVHGIVTRHGGSIEVESEPGIGTVFRIRLPLTERPADAVTPVAEQVHVGVEEQLPAGRRECVLLVEDEPAIRAGLVEVLEALGFDPISAGGVVEAERLAESHDIDLLLSDLGLPDGAGTDLAVRLKERTPRLAVVLMSGYAGRHGDGPERVSEGMRFLQKPFTIATLAAELNEALGDVQEENGGSAAG